MPRAVFPKKNIVKIFDVPFSVMDIPQICQAAMRRIHAAEGLPMVIYTPNPEIVMAAQKDAELMRILQSADVVAADGVGIVWASKYFGMKIKKRASGYDITQELFAVLAKDGTRSAFFFGGAEPSVSGAAVKMEQAYPGLNVCGFRNGYFSPEDEAGIIAQINTAAPDVLLVGLGSPRQERWVATHKQDLCAKVIIVVGGSFDVMSGELRRAPGWMQSLGIEWLYRLLCQPKRFFRMLQLPLFVLKVLHYHFLGKR